VVGGEGGWGSTLKLRRETGDGGGQSQQKKLSRAREKKNGKRGESPGTQGLGKKKTMGEIFCTVDIGRGREKFGEKAVSRKLV